MVQSLDSRGVESGGATKSIGCYYSAPELTTRVETFCPPPRAIKKTTFSPSPSLGWFSAPRVTTRECQKICSVSLFQSWYPSHETKRLSCHYAIP